MLLHHILDFMCHYLSVCHILLFLQCTSPWISLGALFSGVLQTFWKLFLLDPAHLFSKAGIFLHYVIYCSTDIFSWYCFMCCSCWYFLVCSFMCLMMSVLFPWMLISMAFWALCLLFFLPYCNYSQSHLFSASCFILLLFLW